MMASRQYHHRHWPALLLLLLSAAAAPHLCQADDEADRKECTDVLVQMEPCLPFVTSQATATTKPTPDCCSSLNQVMTNNLRCLCVLIKNKDSPFMKQYNVNLDRAVTILGVCVNNASLTTCPKLLNLAPDSPEAKLFKDVEGKLKGNNSTGGSTTGSATATPSTKSPSTSSSGGLMKRHYYYPGMGGIMGWLGGGLWVYTTVAALLLIALLNVHGA